LRLGTRIFALRTGKLCPSRGCCERRQPRGIRECERIARIAIRLAVTARRDGPGHGPGRQKCMARVHGGGEKAVWRKRRDGTSRRGRRGLFAWRVDRPASSRVPWAESLEDDGYDQGRPSGAMPRVYCARCGRPNPDGARFCSYCGTQLTAPVPPGSGMPAGPGTTGGYPAGGPPERPGETTSTISLGRTEDDLGDDLYPDSASFGALPSGCVLLLVMRGPIAGSRIRLDGEVP